jgi:hypothetical protein
LAPLRGGLESANIPRPGARAADNVVMETTMPMRHAAGTTNDDEPFDAGEIVRFRDDDFVVETNHGAGGTVLALGGRGNHITAFLWVYQGEFARRTGRHVRVYVEHAA